MNRPSPALLGLAATVTLVTGCASDPLRYPAITATPTETSEREATSVHLLRGDCANPDKGLATGGAITAALVGIGVDFAMNSVGAALKRLKEGRNATWFAASETNALQPREGDQQFCMIVVRGVFTKTEQEHPLMPAGMGFRDNPAFLARFNLVLGAMKPSSTTPTTPPGAGAAAEGTFLSAKAYDLSYAATSAPVRGSGRKNVSVIVAFSPQTLQPASGAAAAPDTAKASVLRFDFGRLETGRTYDMELLGTVSAATSLPRAGHTTMTAVVSETDSPSAALEAFMTAFDANKGDLGKALKDTVKDAVSESK